MRWVDLALYYLVLYSFVFTLVWCFLCSSVYPHDNSSFMTTDCLQTYPANTWGMWHVTL